MKTPLDRVEKCRCEVLDLSNGSFECRNDGKVSDNVHTALYLKDKTSIFNAGYHELIIFPLYIK